MAEIFKIIFASCLPDMKDISEDNVEDVDYFKPKADPYHNRDIEDSNFKLSLIRRVSNVSTAASDLEECGVDDSMEEEEEILVSQLHSDEPLSSIELFPSLHLNDEPGNSSFLNTDPDPRIILTYFDRFLTNTAPMDTNVDNRSLEGSGFMANEKQFWLQKRHEHRDEWNLEEEEELVIATESGEEWFIEEKDDDGDGFNDGDDDNCIEFEVVKKDGDGGTWGRKNDYFFFGGWRENRRRGGLRFKF